MALISLTCWTHSIPAPAPRLKIAAPLGHSVHSLALIRTMCVCVWVLVCVKKITSVC